MSYYHTLGLVREPFANSPDPDLLYRSKNHLECLQHMEIAVRLRRGLNVVLGEVGTGKTTLCRELQRILGQDPDLDVHLLDDPYFPDPTDFLAALAQLFGVEVADKRQDQARLREAIKAALLRKGGDGRRNVTLLVDEGQKITGECLELLRELLNFETNTHKLLQIVIFAQMEFDDILAVRPNLDDRVNFRYVLQPLNRKQTQRMIGVRLALCVPEGAPAPVLFSDLAMRRIYRLSGGYPRRIVRLCHMAMLLAVGLGRQRIGWGLVGRAAREMRGLSGGRWRRRLSLAAALGGLVATLALSGYGIDAMRRQVAPVAPVAQGGAAASMPVADNSPFVASAAPESAAVAETASAGETSPESVALTEPEGAPLTEPESLSLVGTENAVAAEPENMAQAGPESPAQAVPSEQAVTPAPGPMLALASVHGSGQPAPVALPPVENIPQDLAAQVEPAVAPSPQQSQDEPILVIAAQEDGTSEQTGPAILGSTYARPGWTVTRQATRVYGASSRYILGELAKANPGVDFNRIRAGAPVTFPAIEATPPPKGACLIKVDQAESLEKGFAILTAMQECGAPLALFVTLQPGGTLHFDVVERALYPSAASATSALAELPRNLAAKAKLLESYPRGTIFFTDLSASSIRRSATKSAAVAPRRQVAVTEQR